MGNTINCIIYEGEMRRLISVSYFYIEYRARVRKWLAQLSIYAQEKKERANLALSTIKPSYLHNVSSLFNVHKKRNVEKKNH